MQDLLDRIFVEAAVQDPFVRITVGVPAQEIHVGSPHGDLCGESL